MTISTHLMRVWYASVCIIAGVGFFCSLFCQQAYAKDKENSHIFPYRTETHFRVSDDRQIAVTELWQPVWQRPDFLLYGSLRAMSDRQNNFEGNFGFGARRFYGDHIWGGYGFVDRRVSSFGTVFWQGTGGLEYITSQWEARGNLYIPVPTKGRYQGAGSSVPYAAGTGLYIDTPTTFTEESQPGFDAELGFTLPDFSRFIDSARILGGIYSFKGDETPSLTGVRARAEVDIASWMSVGARAQYDDERGSQYFAEVTFKWPGLLRSQETGLWARMADSPQRDIDIVTENKIIQGESLPIISTQTGEPIKVLYVDNTADVGGTGTVESPFNTLASATEVAEPYDTIYIAAGDGTVSGLDSGYNLTTPNVRIVGQGSEFSFSSGDMQSDYLAADVDLIVRSAGEYPMISSGTGDGVSISADGITIKGVHVDNTAGSGIVIENGAHDIRLENIRVTGSAMHGIEVIHSGVGSTDVQIRDSVISGNRLYGVLTQNTGGGNLVVDLGRADDYGVNDIADNIVSDVHADTGGAAILAQGNYWTAAGSPRLTGPNQGAVDTAVQVAAPFCDECAPAPMTLTSMTDGAPGARVSFTPTTLTGFRGHRYVQVYGDGAPTVRVNGVDSGTDVVKISEGDSIGVDVTLDTTGLSSQSVSLFGASGGVITGTATTEFLPSSVTNLIAWWDGADLDGDFATDDNPSGGTAILSWTDKTGYGHTATGSDTTAPLYDAAAQGVTSDGADDYMTLSNSGYLMALTNGATAALVMKGTSVAAGGAIFRYGTCTGVAASRCFALVPTASVGEVAVRVDTSAARNQISDPALVLDGGVHIVWLSAGPDGSIGLTSSAGGTVADTYNIGGGFMSPGGMRPVGPMAGTYYEMLLFNGAVDSTDRGLVDNYLTNKWGL